MALCDVCEYEIASPSTTPGVCLKCVEARGLDRLPPPCRRAAPCTRCNGMRFARSVAFADGTMTVGSRPNTTDNFFGGRTLVPGRVRSGYGPLEMYTCLGCGFVEWYCRDPEAIKIGPIYQTDVVDYSADQPYR